MLRGIGVVVVVVVLSACSKKEADKVATGAAPAKSSSDPATATVAPAAVTPTPTATPPPSGRTAPTEAEVRKAMMSATKTDSPEFACPGAGYARLTPDAIKALKIISSAIDGDYAVVQADVELKYSAYLDHVTSGAGPVKFRFHWEAEWVLVERDSSAVKCETT